VNFDGAIWHYTNHCEVIALRLSTRLTYRFHLVNAVISQVDFGAGNPTGLRTRS
jgi:hypothetical protein